MTIKVLLISDGRLGERAFENILTKIPETEMAFLEVPDRSVMLDNYGFDADFRSAVSNAILLISYLQHPDVTLELCKFQKPIIIAYYFGEGLLRQAKELNPNVVMPASMCRLIPDTNVPVIDEFARNFGLPVYDIELECRDGAWWFKAVNVVIESPCGSTRRSMPRLVDAPVTEETINAYAITIAQDCRESVAYQLTKSTTSDTAALNHVIPLLAAIEMQAPDLFFENSSLYNYAAEKRNHVRDVPAFSKR
ncbi:MAG TPA: DUF166 family protein [Candidatus Lokiarchaeia archaeon]|nr:DUF166 family protein [Candidatus Lokiarchaeia archaeon]